LWLGVGARNVCAGRAVFGVTELYERDGLALVRGELPVWSWHAGVRGATGQSVSEAAFVIFHAQMKKHKKLEESIRKAISEAMDKEYTRVEEELVRINQQKGSTKSS
jgi:hypothetical protein